MSAILHSFVKTEAETDRVCNLVCTAFNNERKFLTRWKERTNTRSCSLTSRHVQPMHIYIHTHAVNIQHKHTGMHAQQQRGLTLFLRADVLTCTSLAVYSEAQ